MPVHQRPACQVLDLNPVRGHPHQCVPSRDALTGKGPHIGRLFRSQDKLGFPGLLSAQDSAGSVQGERPVMHKHITCRNSQNEQRHSWMPVLRCSGTLLRKDGIVQSDKLLRCAAASSLAFCSCAALIGSSHALNSVARPAGSPIL
jgi:hypothetical protein